MSPRHNMTPPRSVHRAGDLCQRLWAETWGAENRRLLETGRDIGPDRQEMESRGPTYDSQGPTLDQVQAAPSPPKPHRELRGSGKKAARWISQFEKRMSSSRKILFSKGRRATALARQASIAVVKAPGTSIGAPFDNRPLAICATTSLSTLDCHPHQSPLRSLVWNGGIQIRPAKTTWRHQLSDMASEVSTSASGAQTWWVENRRFIETGGDVGLKRQEVQGHSPGSDTQRPALNGMQAPPLFPEPHRMGPQVALCNVNKPLGSRRVSAETV